MAEKEEVKDEGTENFDDSSPETDVNDDESGDASAQDELRDEVKALKSQFARAQQERDALLESIRLQNKLLDQRQSTQAGSTLSPELQEAKKILSPLFTEDLDSKINPLYGTVSQLVDQNDAVAFQLELQRENPELLQGETFDKISQTVEAVRQQAMRETGGWITRSNAYKFAKGAGQLKLGTKKASKEVKKQGSEQKHAQAGSHTNSEQRKEGSINAEIQRIRTKAQAGVKLTPEERVKFRDFLGDNPI